MDAKTEEIISEAIKDLYEAIQVHGARIHLVVFVPTGLGKLATNVWGDMDVVVHDLHASLDMALTVAKKELEQCPTQTRSVN